MLPRLPGASCGSAPWLVAESNYGAGGTSEPIELPLKIVGVVESDVAVVPLPLAVRVPAGNRASCNTTPPPASSSPRLSATQDGFVRCTLIAGDLQAVPALVQPLQLRGFRTVDQLASHHGLLRLARVLTLLVGLAVLGCVLNGAITVLISTLMSVRAKTFEIGILRAHGFRDGEVLAIFLWQAVLLGGLALALAVTVVGLAEPWVRELVCGAIGIARLAFVAVSPFSMSARWLFSVAAAIAVAFSVVGVTIPAAWACRFRPSKRCGDANDAPKRRQTMSGTSHGKPRILSRLTCGVVLLAAGFAAARAWPDR